MIIFCLNASVLFLPWLHSANRHGENSEYQTLCRLLFNTLGKCIIMGNEQLFEQIIYVTLFKKTSQITIILIILQVHMWSSKSVRTEIGQIGSSLMKLSFAS